MNFLFRESPGLNRYVLVFCLFVLRKALLDVVFTICGLCSISVVCCCKREVHCVFSFQSAEAMSSPSKKLVIRLRAEEAEPDSQATTAQESKQRKPVPVVKVLQITNSDRARELAYQGLLLTAASDCAALALGTTTSARVLPWALESHIYSYLAFDDLPMFFFVSKTMAKQVVRYLQTAKLFVAVPTIARKTSVKVENHVYHGAVDVRDMMVALAVRHCTQLQTIDLQWPVQQLAGALVGNNSASLRKCTFSDGHPVVSLCQCPKLEHLHVAFHEVNAVAFQIDIATRQGRTIMSNLKSLEISVDGTTSYQAIESVFSQRTHCSCCLLILSQHGSSQR